MNAVFKPRWVQCDEELAFPLQLNVYICVRKPTSCTVKLYMTPVKTGKWLFSVFLFPCSIRAAVFFLFLTIERDRRSQAPLLLTSLSRSYSLYSCTLLFLLHSHLSFLCSFVLFPSFALSCTLLPSVFFSAPLLNFTSFLSFQLLWECP